MRGIHHFALAACVCCWALFGSVGRARAGDPDDLESDDDTPKPASTAAAAPAPLVAVRGRAYTLEECLALADRNHPNLWAARARLAYFHAQLDEARWVPWWQWSAGATFAVIPHIGGTAFYNASPATYLNPTLSDTLNPFFSFNIGGAVPLYTFGKIDAAKHAAEAQVRVGEWDLEKFRQQVRMDVRRAYFGAMLARDAKYLLDEIVDRLNKAIDGINKRLAKNDASVDEFDRLRLEVYRGEVLSRSAEPQKGEMYALAALRFMTGVQSNFDIPDEPLVRPTVPLGPIVQYVSAARLFRPEVNMARAGVEARKAQLELQKARFFPDIGVGLGASYSTAPTAIIQNNAWVIDPFNRFTYAIGLGVRWSLDLWPNMARVEQVQAQLEETRALERLALGGISVEVEQAYWAAYEADQRERSWAATEHQTKGWISSVQDAIDVGSKDERALMEPLRAYVNARINHLYAMHDLSIALSDLARVSGWDKAAPN